MTDKEKKVLFEALNEILTNQSKIMLHNGTVNSNDDLYYTKEFFKDIIINHSLQEFEIVGAYSVERKDVS